jgi:predicted ATP-grasp superfamily ATP-dependent carboligase
MGVPVVGITDQPQDAFAQSRYCMPLYCEDIDGAGLLRLLLDLGQQARLKPVLFLTLDQSVRLVSKVDREMRQYFLLTMPEPATVNLLMDKSQFFHWAQSEGLAIPPTYLIASENDLLKALGKARFPCIFKPSIKTRKFTLGTPQKAFLVQDKEELYRLYWMWKQWVPRMVLQEWIPGTDQNLIFGLFYCDHNGHVKAHFSGRKVRQYIPDCGTASMAEAWADAQALAQTHRILERLRYRGVGAIEYKLDTEDNTYKVLELTVGRTEHLFALASANGTNIPYQAYCDLIQQPQQGSSRQRIKTKYLYWRRDFLAAKEYMRRGDLSVRDWLASLRGPKEFTLLAADDLGPILTRLQEKVRIQSRLVQLWRRSGGIIHQAASGVTSDIFANPRLLSLLLKDKCRIRSKVVGRREHIRAALDWLLRAKS